jgi:hypothetical protein
MCIMNQHKPVVGVRLEIELLEDRAVPSALAPNSLGNADQYLHGDSYLHQIAPDTGGAAFQTGSLLTVDLRNKVGQPGQDTTTIIDDGKGGIQVSWDGGPVHSFTGISQIVFNSAQTQNEQVTFKLAGPLATPLDVQLNLNGKDNIVTEQVGNNGVIPSGLTFEIVTLRHNATTQTIVTP